MKQKNIFKIVNFKKRFYCVLLNPKYLKNIYFRILYEFVTERRAWKNFIAKGKNFIS